MIAIAHDERPNPPGSASFLRRTWPKWLIGLCLAGHVWATCHTLPLSAIWQYPVLAYNDFAIHAHRAHVFRESFRTSGDTWGCDPAVCGGTVMQPTQDVGSAIYEIVALLFPHAETGKLVTAVVWCAMLIAPLFLLWAGRLLDFAAAEIAWGLLIAEGFQWLAPAHRLLLYVGMAAFLLSSYICLFVFAVFVRFLRRPTACAYVGTIAAASVLFFVHPFGPLAIAPGLVWLIARTPGVGWRWRSAALIIPLPVAALNAFWLAPVLAGLRWPTPPWATGLNLSLPYWNWESWSDFFSWVPPELLVGLGAVVVLSGLGLAAIARRQPPATTVAIGVTLLVTVSLFFFGSLWSATRILQPLRFIAVFMNLAALLSGCVIAAVGRRLRLSWRVSSVTYVVAGGALVAAVGIFGQRLTPPQDEVGLVDFIQHRTRQNDRVLLEAAGPYPWLGLGLPAITQREIISTAYPDAYDPIQFGTAALFGQSAENISTAQVKEVLARFRVNWVIARNRQWREFFRKLTGTAGEVIGPYEAFAVGRDQSRFVIGSGEVRAGINRLELLNVSSPEDYVVIRYRYHPGWVSDGPSTIESFPTPDKSGGLLRIRHPLPTTVLRFDPNRALRTPWPRPIQPTSSEKH